ncbi:MAG: polyphosphate kinase 1 [Bacteroidia bacterium]
MNRKKEYFNRDISWLSFNQRVLQEAEDPSVPLYERMKFLAIFSSNLDEFYRIRVAEWKRLNLLVSKTRKNLKENPKEVLRKIDRIVQRHQDRFNKIFWGQIMKELAERNVFIINEKQLSKKQEVFVRTYFEETVKPHIKPMVVAEGKTAPLLDDKSIYLALKLCDFDKPGPRKFEYVIVEIPSRKVPRFLALPPENGKQSVIILGDVLRLCLQLQYFEEYEIVEAYSIKLTRDAELQLEDEFSGNLLKKVKKGISARVKGHPTRLLYDKSMPADFLSILSTVFDLNKSDLTPGGRYHNFGDLMGFPNFGLQGIHYENLPPLRIKSLDDEPSLFDAISKRDYLLHFPYHSYDYVIRFVNEAAVDEKVRSIKITLYRAADHSKIIEALLKARENGKQVTAFIELKARFDEESNIHYAKELEEAGAKVLYSFPILKVHAKMLYVERIEDDKLRRYSYLSTGNFNENTARLYGDTSLFTRDKYMGREVASVFDILADTRIKRAFQHLLVAPDHMRHDLYGMIDREIKNALKGKPAMIFLKLNSLQDRDIIEKLYEASQEGVEVRLIIRGICCLVSGVKGLSENIKAISIVDRYLEHSRVLIFGNDGEPRIFLSSADWMERNLSRRFEVGFPIYQPELKREIIEMMEIQWRDNSKARIINKMQNNAYRKTQAQTKRRAQTDLYSYLKEKVNQ